MSGRGYWKGRAVTPFQWELLRERAQLDDDAIPPAKECEGKPLGDLLGAALKGLRLETRLGVSRLGAVWPEMVGDVLAKHTRPADLERGVLEVRVSHPGFLMELRGGPEKMILQRIRERFPELPVKRIRWSVGAL